MMRRIVKALSRFRKPQYRADYRSRDVLCHHTARLIRPDRMNIGKWVRIGPRCNINAEGGLTIGDGTIFAPEVVVLTSSHDHRKGELLPYDVFDVHRPVTIGRGVWFGYRALVCPGVTIGDGAIVGMGAVVTRDVGKGVIVGGNPAVPIGSRPEAEVDQRVAEGSFFHKKYWEAAHRPRARTDD
jgi:maltose O-acetyltransferase